MLYSDFDAVKNTLGQDFFKGKVDKEIADNLNPNLPLREYQKEAVGRFVFYNEEYPQKKFPTHLLFNMATGSGKTLIMAALIIDLYKKGYRNFIFFVKSTNIIDKTKTNFLNPISQKYLFADKVQIGDKEILIKEVDNFEAANPENINILFATTALLHFRLNFPRENSITYEDLASKKLVLIADEAHNLMADTLARRNKTEEEEYRSWQSTARQILSQNKENILLEFTATARLENLQVSEEYNDKVIYRYDLKAYRQDGFSKDVKLIQVGNALFDRVLTAIIISQYRRKIAEKYRIALKPVILLKANRVSVPKEIEKTQGDNPQLVVSSDFKKAFHEVIKRLSFSQVKKLKLIQNPPLQKAFHFFEENKVSLDELVEEIKTDFAEEKCLTVDEEKDLQEKQTLVNSLEEKDNEIRAVFATEKLNEGWDVLNLFDIVRLYNTRDAKANKPGSTTVQEAQLIGRGARYYPFKLNESDDMFKRKFDSDINNELRVLEQLYYHSAQNSRYIQELESALVEEGIIAPRTVERELKIKPKFKESYFWKDGIIFLNERKEYVGSDIFGIEDTGVDLNSLDLQYELDTGAIVVSDPFTGERIEKSDEVETREFKLLDFGVHIVRSAISKYPEYEFKSLRQQFGNLESISDFISKPEYLGGLKVKVKGSKLLLDNLTPLVRLKISLYVLSEILKKLQTKDTEYIGTKKFIPYQIKQKFYDKVLQLDEDNPRAREMRDFPFESEDWYAQNEVWGTSEEESFLRFMKDVLVELKKRFIDISLVRNEQFIRIFDFDTGEPFYPDFVLFLRNKGTKKALVYQVFIEPKGDQFKDASGGFEQSKEGWKQALLLQLEKNFNTDLRVENKDFKLIGLPFFNESLKSQFEEAFEEKLVNN